MKKFLKKNKFFSYIKIFPTFLLALTFLFASCFKNSLASAPTKAIKVQSKQIKNNQVGQFILQYQPASSTSYKIEEIPAILSNQEIRKLLIDSKIFDNLISDLNKSGLVIRENIPVVFKECGQANAYWNPSEKEIIICYENTALDLILFHSGAKYPVDKAVEKSIHETIFAFYHELGHALINVLPLSAVGQEEDTVDEFAAVMLFREYSPSVAAQIVLDSSEFYELLYKAGSRVPGWDEHTPNDKRLFNLVCFVYGSNPEQYAQVFVEKFVLIDNDKTASEEQLKRRAYKCQQEFPQKMASWNKLLIPHYASQNHNQPAQKPPNNSPGVSRRGSHW